MTTTTGLGITLIEEGQDDKEGTANDGFGVLDARLTKIASVDVSSGNVTLTAAEYQQNAVLFITGATTGGRTVTTPALRGVMVFRSAPANTQSVSIVRGSTSLTLAPGQTLVAAQDGTTNDLNAVLRGQQAAPSFLGLSDTFASFAGAGGQALRVNAGASAVEAYQPPYDISRYVAGALTASQLLVRIRFVRAVRIPAGLALSDIRCGVAATGSTVIEWKKNGAAAFGTATIAAAGTVATLAAASDTDFAAGDVLTITGPASPDATAADFDIGIAGLKL